MLGFLAFQVVDPNTLDYDSEYESDDRQSDTEINELDGKNVSMCKFCDHAFTDKVRQLLVPLFG